MRTDNVSQVIAVDDGTSFQRGTRGVAADVAAAGGMAGGMGGGFGGRGGQRQGAQGAAPAPPESITLADIKVGDAVMATGTLKGGVFTALKMGVQEPGAGGAGRNRQGPGAIAGRNRMRGPPPLGGPGPAAGPPPPQQIVSIRSSSVNANRKGALSSEAVGGGLCGWISGSAVLVELGQVRQVCQGSVFVQRVNGMQRFWVVAMGAAMVAGAGDLRGMAQDAAAPAAATTQAPAAAAPAPAVETPAAQAPAATAPATPVVAAAPQGGTIKGTVKASGVPLPGVAVTATNSLTGKKYATTTDVNGVFQMDVPRNGRYVLKTELTGFASVTQEVVVNAASENGGLPVQTAEFKMDLASRVAPEPAQTAAAADGATGTYGVR